MSLKPAAGVFLTAAVVIAILTSGCASNDSAIVADGSGATQEGIESVVSANNRFAFEVYSELREEDGNLFFSPYSIMTALAMTYEGARGETEEEMRAVLHVPEDADLRRPAFATIYNLINKKDKEYKLSTANALWAQKDYIFLDEYTDGVERYYGGKVTNLDFVGETESSRLTINRWVEEQTNNKIKDLIRPGVLGPLTRLVITNAIYFKGKWLMQFDKKNTIEDNFRTDSGDVVRVQMMSLTGEDVKFNYAEDEEVQVLEMPYEGEELSMIILLAKEGQMESFEESLDMERVSALREMLSEQRVNVYIPKFTFDTKYSLNGILAGLGMPTAFSRNADFSGMDGTKSLYISDVIHQAFVEVNEEGTEAAAATAVVMKLTSLGPQVPTFRADRPFIFIIQERETGNILFAGRVNDPTK